MTKEEITRMAREAGFVQFDGENKCLRNFAALVADAEREACAKVCDEQGKGRKALEHYAALTYSGATHDCAEAIRARKETK